MKLLYTVLGLLCVVIAISGLLAVSKDYGEILQFFILAALCFRESERM